MHVVVTKNRCTVIGAKGKVKPAIRKNSVDDAEIIENLHTPRLQAFPTRSSKIICSFVDDSEAHATTSKIACKGKAGRSCPNNQY
jgi:hypothetical protein